MIAEKEKLISSIIKNHTLSSDIDTDWHFEILEERIRDKSPNFTYEEVLKRLELLVKNNASN